MLFKAYTTALNSALTFDQALAVKQEDLLNAYTWGYKERYAKVVPTSFGTYLADVQGSTPEGGHVFLKGEKITKLAIDKDHPYAYFLVKDGDSEYLTRLGDLKYTRRRRLENTYIGQAGEERTYLTTQEGYMLMGRPIGRGPVEQQGRYKDPLNPFEPVILGRSRVKTDSKVIGGDVPLQKGPLIPIDLTRDQNGLILGKYSEVEVNKEGVVRGNKDGLWVPLYQVATFTVPNPDGLQSVGETAYKRMSENSGLKKELGGIKIRPEYVEKSNVNVRAASYEFKKMRNNLNIALSLQQSNTRILQRFQQLLDSA